MLNMGKQKKLSASSYLFLNACHSSSSPSTTNFRL